MMDYTSVFIFEHDCNKKITELLDLIWNHAQIATREDRRSWCYTCFHDSVYVNFNRRDDWRFFNKCFVNKHKELLKQEGISFFRHD